MVEESETPKGDTGRKPDPYYEAAVHNAKEAARRLFEAGIVDAGAFVRIYLQTCVKRPRLRRLMPLHSYSPKISSKPYAQAA